MALVAGVLGLVGIVLGILNTQKLSKLLSHSVSHFYSVHEELAEFVEANTAY